VSLTLVMQFSELSLHQLLAQLDQLAPQLIAILIEDVSTIQLFAMLLDVLTTNATLLLTNVKSLFLAVMMVMHAPMIPSTHPLAVSTLLNVLLLMHVPSQLVMQEHVKILQRIVMMEMYVPLILAIFALDLASTLQSLALVELETLELATLKLQNVSSEKHVLITATVMGTETQLTFHTVILESDVTIH